MVGEILVGFGKGGVTCLGWSLACRSAFPAPASCSGSWRTGAQPRRPHRSRRSQQLPGGKGHLGWHISVAQRLRNSTSRREQVTQGSAEPAPTLVPYWVGSSRSYLSEGTAGGDSMWKYLYVSRGRPATAGGICSPTCHAGTALWTLCEGMLGSSELLTLA